MNPERDQIIELSIQHGLERESSSKTWRIKPDTPITAGAQAIHGISMEDLLSAPRFPDVGDEIGEMLGSCEVLIGYNIEFDLKLLQAELRRAKKPELNFSSKLIVDPLQLWRRFEPRNLSAAFRRFAGEELQNAHSSREDVMATGLVLSGMFKQFQLQEKEWEEIAEICDPVKKTWIGPSHHVQWRANVPVIAFGKHTGKPISVLASEDGGSYLKWILGKDFPEHVKSIAKQALQSSGDDLCKWIGEVFVEKNCPS